MKATKYILVYLMPFFMGLSIACFKSCQQAPKMSKTEQVSLIKMSIAVQAPVR
jgi:hypothetical protein